MKPRQRFFFWAAILFLATVLLYGNSLRYGMVWDDTTLYAASGKISDPGIIKDAFTKPVDRLYRPLRTLMFAAENTLGHSPVIPHAINVILYAITCILFFLLANQLTQKTSSRIAPLAALLFLAHPLHAEVVASLSNGRADLLCAVFLFAGLTMLASDRRKKFFILSLMFFALALFSKESAAVAPALVFFLIPAAVRGSRHNGAGQSLKPAFFYSALVLLPVLAFLFFRFGILHIGGQITFWHGGSFRSTAFTSLSLIPGSVASLFLPIKTCPLYFVPKIFEPTFMSIFGILVLGAMLTAGIYLFRRVPFASLVFFWILITWLPVSNLVPLAALKADRFLFLPSAGACLLTAALFDALMRRIENKLPARSVALWAAVTALPLFYYTATAWRASAVWRNESTLWRRAVCCAPRSPMAWNNYGKTLYDTGRPQAAEAALKKSLALNPGFIQPYNNLAEIHGARGRYVQAVEMLLKSNALRPGVPRTECKLGVAYYKLGRAAESQAWYNACGRHNGKGAGTDEAHH